MKKYLIALSILITSQSFAYAPSLNVKEFEESFQNPPKGTKQFGITQTDFFTTSMLLNTKPLNDQKEIKFELRVINHSETTLEKYAIIRYDLNCKTSSQNSTSFIYNKNGNPILSNNLSRNDYKFILQPYQIKRLCP